MKVEFLTFLAIVAVSYACFPDADLNKPPKELFEEYIVSDIKTLEFNE